MDLNATLKISINGDLIILCEDKAVTVHKEDAGLLIERIGMLLHELADDRARRLAEQRRAEQLQARDEPRVPTPPALALAVPAKPNRERLIGEAPRDNSQEMKALLVAAELPEPFTSRELRAAAARSDDELTQQVDGAGVLYRLTERRLVERVDGNGTARNGSLYKYMLTTRGTEVVLEHNARRARAARLGANGAAGDVQVAVAAE